MAISPSCSPASLDVGHALDPGVLVVEKEVVHVLGRHRLVVHPHRPRGPQHASKRDGVEGQHAVHRSSTDRRPHPRRQRGVSREPGRKTEVAPLAVGYEAPPPVSQVAILDRGRHLGRHRELTGRAELAQRQISVRCLQLPGAEEHSGARAHLGIVGRQHEVAARPFQEAGQALQGRAAVPETGAGVCELLLQLSPLGGEGAHQRPLGSELHGPEPGLRSGGQPRQVAHEHDPLRPAGVRL